MFDWIEQVSNNKIKNVVTKLSQCFIAWASEWNKWKDPINQNTTPNPKLNNNNKIKNVVTRLSQCLIEWNKCQTTKTTTTAE